jgi:hypothetical protein
MTQLTACLVPQLGSICRIAILAYIESLHQGCERKKEIKYKPCAQSHRYESRTSSHTLVLIGPGDDRGRGGGCVAERARQRPLTGTLL